LKPMGSGEGEGWAKTGSTADAGWVDFCGCPVGFFFGGVCLGIKGSSEEDRGSRTLECKPKVYYRSSQL
jgi:hypothetical protein